jgi:hypothetical protein
MLCTPYFGGHSTLSLHTGASCHARCAPPDSPLLRSTSLQTHSTTSHCTTATRDATQLPCSLYMQGAMRSARHQPEQRPACHEPASSRHLCSALCAHAWKLPLQPTSHQHYYPLSRMIHISRAPLRPAALVGVTRATYIANNTTNSGSTTDEARSFILSAACGIGTSLWLDVHHILRGFQHARRLQLTQHNTPVQLLNALNVFSKAP